VIGAASAEPLRANGNQSANKAPCPGANETEDEMEQTHYTVRVKRTTTEYYDYEISLDLSFFPEYEEAEIAALDDVVTLDKSNRIDWVILDRDYETVDIKDVVLEFDHGDGGVSRFVHIGNGKDEEE
jgi:hypothetical protein